jgi:beta-galactosidase
MTINADGEDVAILRVETLDSAGRHVPVADNMIQFKVKGEGSLIGVGNGDPNSQESDKEPKRSLFNGLAQVIAQSTKAAGEISITAWTEEFPGPKLPPFTLTVKTSQIELRPQVK